jgi:hypothetical protein
MLRFQDDGTEISGSQQSEGAVLINAPLLFRLCGPLSDRDPILVPVTQVCERRSTEARKGGRLLGVTLDEVLKPDPAGRS